MVAREDNPFEDEVIAKEWVNSIEKEEGLIRDTDIYPMLSSWVSETRPKILVEIGSGQGICSSKLGTYSDSYIGIEPSIPLVKRAQERYAQENRSFITGNVYTLPLPTASVDAVFSVNVWFHLRDLATASLELARILKLGGKFLIITANPAMNDAWESMFYDYSKDGKKLDGKVRVPINDLSRNVLFLHTLDDITSALLDAGLTVISTRTFGVSPRYPGLSGFFLAIEGER